VLQFVRAFRPFILFSLWLFGGAALMPVVRMDFFS